MLHCVSCVTLRYVEAVLRLIAMTLTISLRRRQRSKGLIGVVVLICMNTSYYYLHSDCTHAPHNSIYTMMGLDIPKGRKGSVTLRANTC
jgi:hypothetical protein